MILAEYFDDFGKIGNQENIFIPSWMQKREVSNQNKNFQKIYLCVHHDILHIRQDTGQEIVDQ